MERVAPPTSTVTANVKTQPSRKVLRRFRREWPLHLMVVPGIIVVIIYCYVPMAGISMAFENFNPFQGMFHSPWAGLSNFTYILNMPNIFQVFWNTVIIALLKIAANLVVPIIVALLLNEVGKHLIKRGVQTLIYLPHFLSWVILGGILIDILSPTNGIVNEFLGLFGIKPIFFLGSNTWFRPVLVISDVWQNFGFNTIVYLAAITNINPNLYEAAAIDGANRWRQTSHVTLPGMLPIIILLSTLSLGNVLNAGFDQVFNLYSPIVYQTGDIIDTLVYRTGLLQAQYSVATAVGLFKSVVSFVFISVSYWLAYRFADYRIF